MRLVVVLVVLIAGVSITSAVAAEDESEPVEEVQIEFTAEDSNQMEEVHAVDEETNMEEHPVLEETPTQ